MHLTIGMAVYDNFGLTAMTLQALRMRNISDLDLIVVDNHPSGQEAHRLQAFCKNVDALYVPFPSPVGTSAPRDEIFNHAKDGVVCVIDNHVLFELGALGNLIHWAQENPDDKNLWHGPIIGDNGQVLATEMRPIWGSDLMFGTWYGRELENEEPFEISMHGMGCFACHKDAWLGFPCGLMGFGGEEGMIHEKYRQAGRKTLCLPFLRWWHLFGAPIRYPLNHEDRFRNYLIWYKNLGLDETELIEKFSPTIPNIEDIVSGKAQRGTPITQTVTKTYTTQAGFCHYVPVSDTSIQCVHCKTNRTIEPGFDYTRLHSRCKAQLLKPKAQPKKAAAAAPPKDVSCTHRLSQLRSEPCKSCGGKNVKVKVFGCDLYGECVIGANKVGIRNCLQCKDLTPVQKTITLNATIVHPIDALYERACKIKSDINEHLPTLRALASECDHVTEFGVRTAVSTVALLAGKPKQMVSYDIKESSQARILEKIYPHYHFLIGDSREVDIEPTDLLFIDTKHTADQLSAELIRHAIRVRKYIVLHDTVSYGEIGETGGPGLNDAISNFFKYVDTNADWTFERTYTNNNGLTILKRNVPAESVLSVSDVQAS